MKQKANFLRIKNKDIEYIKMGAGEDALFIHGGTVSYRSNLSFLKKLSKFFTVWALSLPGAGRSSTISKSWKLKDSAKVIKDFVRKQDIDPILFGHSLGGAVAIQSTLDYPELFKRLVLLAPAAIPQRNSNKSVLRVIENHLKTLFGKKSYAKEDLQINLKRHFRDMLLISNIYKKVDFRDQLKDIKSKVIIFGGENDEVINSENWKYIDDLIPNSKLVLLPAKHNFLTDHSNIIIKEIQNYYE